MNKGKENINKLLHLVKRYEIIGEPELEKEIQLLKDTIESKLNQLPGQQKLVKKYKYSINDLIKRNRLLEEEIQRNKKQ